MTDKTSSIKRGLERTSPPEKKLVLLPTGSTMLNLACSDSPFVGFAAGTVVNIVGDKSAGKTLLTLTCMACIANDKKYDDYKIIYDDAEHASQFDIEYLFGKKTSERIEPPRRDKEGFPHSSSNVEEFWAHIGLRIKKNEKFIYVLDSYDSLGSDEDVAFEKALIAGIEKDKEVKEGGGYGTKGAKTLSKMFRTIIEGLKATESLLIVVSQVRETINALPFQKKYYRAGGKALGHYAFHEIWLRVDGQIKETKSKRIIGHTVTATTDKNKVTGKLRTASFNTYYDYGVDDTTSCVEFMIKEGGWKKDNSPIVPVGLWEDQRFQNKNVLVEAIESNNEEKKLAMICGRKWREIEDSLKLNRKRRFF